MPGDDNHKRRPPRRAAAVRAEEETKKDLNWSGRSALGRSVQNNNSVGKGGSSNPSSNRNPKQKVTDGKASGATNNRKPPGFVKVRGGSSKPSSNCNPKKKGSSKASGAGKTAAPKRTAPKKKGKGNGQSGRARKTTATSNTTGRKRKANFQGAGPGYRLEDGKQFPNPSSGKRGKSDIEGDGVEGLVAVFAKKGGTASEHLKSLVARQKAVSNGQASVFAVETGRFSFDEIKGGTEWEGGKFLGTRSDFNEAINLSELGEIRRLLPINLIEPTKMGSKYLVSYAKEVGVGNVSYCKVMVEIVPPKEFMPAVEYLHHMGAKATEDSDSKDHRLRGNYIAELSQDLFWSIVFHCSEGGTKKDGLTVDGILCELWPGLDWSQLGRGGRKRRLSRKARENMQQMCAPWMMVERTKISDLVEGDLLLDLDKTSAHVLVLIRCLLSDRKHDGFVQQACMVVNLLSGPGEEDGNEDNEEETDDSDGDDKVPNESSDSSEESSDDEDEDEEDVQLFDEILSALERCSEILSDEKVTDTFEYGALLIIQGLSYLWEGAEARNWDEFKGQTTPACVCFQGAFSRLRNMSKSGMGSARVEVLSALAAGLAAREIKMAKVNGVRSFCDDFCSREVCTTCTGVEHQQELCKLYLLEGRKIVGDILMFLKEADQNANNVHSWQVKKALIHVSKLLTETESVDNSITALYDGVSKSKQLGL